MFLYHPSEHEATDPFLVEGIQHVCGERTVNQTEQEIECSVYNLGNSIL